MTPLKNQRFLAIAVLVALLVGFGVARLLDKPLHALSHTHAEGEGSAHGGDHDDHDDDHAENEAHDHSDEEGHGHGGEEEGHSDEEEEGTVALTARQIEASGITLVGVGRGGGHETRLSGRVEPAIDARVSVAATLSGRIERVAVAPGAAVEAGATLAVLVSGEAATLRAQADAASAEAETARLVHQRDVNLVEQGVVARQELEASRARALAAEAAARAARAQVAAAGSPDAQGRVAITSPLAGTVGLVGVSPGGFVSSGTLIADVSDPARTEFVFTAPPQLAAQVTAGSRMTVAGPGGDVDAVVLGVAPGTSDRSGAALIRARPVTGTLPPAGSLVSGTVVTLRQDDGLTVPADAVQTVEGQAVVFVVIDGGFRATPVLAGRRAGGRIEILKGLTGDERIAGANAFLLKAELAKGEAEHVH